MNYGINESKIHSNSFYYDSLINNNRFIIGGWFGRGTFASNDVHMLELESLKWKLCQTSGLAPGPCNMHSADSILSLIYIFRGGDG